MQHYPIPLVPGPVRVPQAVLHTMAVDYGSGDIEPEYGQAYEATEKALQTIIGTKNRIAILTGEGMVALWAALKSTIQPGDRVLAISTGYFGAGIGQMAANIGADVRTVDFEYYEVADDRARMAAAIEAHRPKMVTLVHCETPSGTLNPASLVGELVREYEVPLFYVDAVASAGGTPLEVDAWGIDLALLGSQKAFSAPPMLGMVGVSTRAWEIIEAVNYMGYDALLPWREAGPGNYPYTPPWSAVAALHRACQLILDEGLNTVFARHADVAAGWRRGLQQLGFRLFPTQEESNAPTVTAAWLPNGWAWDRFNMALRTRGMVVGGTWGPYEGKIFRVGHMGSQATRQLMEEGLGILHDVLDSTR